PSTIACGNCSYCRAGYYSQCNNANPNGPEAGTAFYGGPKLTGPFHGMQAEYVRVPFAQINLVKLPDEISDDDAILVSDIFPTGYMAAELADIHSGKSVAIFGCGPVGQFAIPAPNCSMSGASSPLMLFPAAWRWRAARAQKSLILKKKIQLRRSRNSLPESALIA